MRQIESELQALNTQVVIVSATPPEVNAEHARKLDVPFPVLSDVDRGVYDLYGVPKTPVHKMFTGRVAVEAFRTLGGGFLPGKPEGEMLRLPAVFLVDKQGILRWAYVGEDMADRPPPEDVLAAVRALSQG